MTSLAGPRRGLAFFGPLLDWVTALAAIPVLVIVAMALNAQVHSPTDGLEWQGRRFEVVSVVPGGPGDLAGIRVGDRVLSIDGVPTSRRLPVYNPDELGPHTLRVQRGDEVISADVTVTHRSLQSLSVRLLNLGTAVLFSVLAVALTVGGRASGAGIAFSAFYQTLAITIAAGVASGLQFDWAIRAFQISIVVLAPAGLAMSLTFPVVRRDAGARRMIFASCIIAVLLLIPLVVLPGSELLGDGVGYRVYEAALLVMLVTLMVSIRVIGASFAESRDAQVRSATRISALGLATAVFPVIGLYLVPRMLVGRWIISAEVALLFLTFMPLYQGFALTRRKLWGLEQILPQVSAAVLTGTFFVSVILGTIRLVSGLWPGLGEGAVITGAVVGAIALAVINVPVISGSRRLVHHAFYGQGYDYQSFVSETSRDLAQAAGHDELRTLVVTSPSRRMNLAGAVLLSTRADSNCLTVEAAYGNLSWMETEEVSITLSHPLGAELRRSPQPRMRERLQEILKSYRLGATEVRLLQDESLALWAPVHVKGSLRGLVILGQKMQDALFSRDDIDIISTFAGQVGVSMENADLYDHLRAEMRKLQEMQSQLVQAEKLSAVGQLVSGVAHELNNPLTTVIGFAELRRAAAESEQEQSDLDNILSSAERARRIVRNLLSFARRHSGEKHMVSLNDIIRQTVEIQAYQLRVDDVSVVMELEERLPPTAAVGFEIQQVFLNIIMNAHQAIRSVKESGTITVRTWQPDAENIRIAISDDGPGIPADSVVKVFDPFFTTKSVGVGTGLGLSICYGIIRAHDGRIWAESPPGRGATFFVELPLVSVSATSPSVLTDTPLTQAGMRVLVVEDELSVGAVLRRLLTKLDCEVDIASSGLEALRLLEERKYDTVITDVRMPHMSGIDLWHAIREADEDFAQRVIFVTGDVANIETAAALEATEQPVLMKPFGTQELAEALAALTRRLEAATEA